MRSPIIASSAAWFRVNLEGPFVPGEVARGNITYPGYEHVVMTVKVTRMEAPRHFAFTPASIRHRAGRGLFRGDADAR